MTGFGGGIGVSEVAALPLCLGGPLEELYVVVAGEGRLAGVLASWAAGRWHHTVHAQVLDHLPIVVEGVNQGLNDERQASYRSR